MKKLLLASVLLHVLAGVGLGGETWSAKCVEVIDGDSIVVDRYGLEGEIRLYGIDCPEKGRPFAAEATEFTRKMVKGKQIQIEPLKKDQYRRTVARVKVDGKSLEHELLKAGLAVWYFRYAPDNHELEYLELEARTKGHGLWAPFRKASRDRPRKLDEWRLPDESEDYGPEPPYDLDVPMGPGGR